MYRVVYYSVRENGPAGELPRAFSTLAETHDYTQRALWGLSTFHRAEIIDHDGETVATGRRAGAGGTSNRWHWSRRG